MKITGKDVYIFSSVSTRFITLAALVSSISFWVIGKSPKPYVKNAATCFLVLSLTFIPYIINKKSRLSLPYTLQAATVEFFFLSVFLGEAVRFYDKFHWWDVMLHVYSGIIFGLIGFFMLCSINPKKNAVFGLSRINIFMFVLCFATFFGVLWEIFEFAGDAALGMNMQKSVYIGNISQMEAYVNKWGRMMDPGLVDTMKDLIADVAGATLASVGSLFIHHNRYKELNTSATHK